jgi:hypothetical protein
VENEYLPELAGTYLEDSYFLGALAEGGDLRLKFLFALTTDHPDYTPSKPGEVHCYREGSIVLQQPSIVEWKPGTPAITRDSDGTFDFGGIQLYRLGPTRFRFVTEWFDGTVDTEHLDLHLSDASV